MRGIPYLNMRFGYALQTFHGKAFKKLYGIRALIKKSLHIPFLTVSEYGNRNKKFLFEFLNFPVICKAAAGNNTMHMHMISDLLVPGVQYPNNVRYCTEILFIRRKFKKCLPRSICLRVLKTWSRKIRK